MPLDASSRSKAAAGLSLKASNSGFGPGVQRTLDAKHFVLLEPFRYRQSPRCSRKNASAAGMSLRISTCTTAPTELPKRTWSARNDSFASCAGMSHGLAAMAPTGFLSRSTKCALESHNNDKRPSPPRRFSEPRPAPPLESKRPPSPATQRVAARSPFRRRLSTVSSVFRGSSERLPLSPYARRPR
jgi:hypothetical protein